MRGALEGVKVVDMTRVLAGPYCCMQLADMGADVIKIERPGRGDDTRQNAPFLNGESTYFMNVNRNKRSITLDLKSEKGKEIFRKLVKEADIVVQNFRPGVMEKLGFPYEELKRINPKIVYGCISGYGQYGPYSQQPGYDTIGQAMSGLMSLTGEVGGPPIRTGAPLGDVMAGISACAGILAGYISAQKTGEGRMIDVSLTDGVTSIVQAVSQAYFATGEVPSRDNPYMASFPFGAFPARDRYMVLTCGNDKLFNIMAHVMDHEDWLTDPRYASNALRAQNHEPLDKDLRQWLSQHDAQEAVDMLTSAGFPAAVVLGVDEVAKDPHVAGAREMFPVMDHPVAGKFHVVGNQIKMNGQSLPIRMPAPLLGQHTDEILKSLGYSDEEIAVMHTDGTL